VPAVEPACYPSNKKPSCGKALAQLSRGKCLCDCSKRNDQPTLREGIESTSS